MSAGPRRARLRALAKINLGLKVLGRRPDGYHELRTVFQTISLADELEVEFTPARATAIEVRSEPDIPGNLVERAARLALEAMRLTGRVALRLRKRIPMGAGLGGGSSDAAAVLLALPALAGRVIPLERLVSLGAQLGSDVPFFLLGGTAVGLGRGEELYPLPDGPAASALVVAPEVHVSTAEAYRALGRPPDEFAAAPWQNVVGSFQSAVWRGFAARSRNGPSLFGENDFESVVFPAHPLLASLKRRLQRAGADSALLSGSGAALFGLFASRREAGRARDRLSGQRTFLVSLVSRARYHAMWWRRLAPHVAGKVWPPQSRYA